MFNEKIIKVIEDTLKKVAENPWMLNYDRAKEIARALWNSGLVSNSSKSLDEQEPNIYMWTAIENDGYTHSEIGVANNMLEAFIKATEHSPSYHKYIEIKKLDEKEYTDASKKMLEWHKEYRCDEYCLNGDKKDDSTC